MLCRVRGAQGKTLLHSDVLPADSAPFIEYYVDPANEITLAQGQTRGYVTLDAPVVNFRYTL